MELNLQLADMDDSFKIYIEQLRDGREEHIEEKLDPVFLDIQDEDLKFEKPVELQGVAYLADNELVLHWNIHTEALLPCSICNEPVAVQVQVQNFYYCVPTQEIKTGIYNFKELLRETILLELPGFAECNQGKCPKRKEYKKFLKELSDPLLEKEEGYQPFADLDWKS